MHSEIPPHEKIRFRRSDIASLDILPSAVPMPRPARLSRASRRLAKIVLAVVGGLCVAVALAVAVIIAGLGNERLRVEAQQAVSSLAGDGFEVGIGGVGIFLDGLRGLALQIDDISVASGQGADATTRIGSARFGLGVLPLLRGQLKLGTLSVSDAAIALGALPRPEGGAGFAVFDEDGLVNPDLVNAGVFDGLRGLADMLGARGVRRMEARNVDLLFAEGDSGRLHVASASLQRRSGEGLRLSAAIETMGRPVTLRGEAALDAASGRVAALDLHVEMAAAQVAPGDASPLRGIGAATLTVSGMQRTGGDRLAISGRIDKADIAINDRDSFVADLDFAATTLGGSGKLEIERLRVVSGRSTWNFHGAFGPAPRQEAAEGGAAPSYRFELVSDGSTVAPQDSSEPTLRVLARVAGRLDADASRLDIDQIGVRSSQGEVSGRAAVHLARGRAPGFDVRIDVGDMPVGHAKQLWPWFAASSARRWVTSNLFGGHVEGGWVEVSLPAGRLGNGVPLQRDEVSGFFKVSGTRFDVAGRIPPVRGAGGRVAFFGTDVEIELDEGTVYMPSGRTVAASDGTLEIRDAHIRPVIGKLDIGVAGEADAILELASYDPIDVGRFVELKPEDMEGAVEGRVTADIPFNRDIPVETLGWRVELAYDDLAVARPFEGQMVSAATGTIVVDPQRAVIEARARLNDMPATLRLTEPLGNSGHERRRHVALDMDDAARAAIAPGLDALLSGLARVEVDGTSQKGVRTIRADLGAARLSVPWIGWSKGTGVPATVSFDLKTGENRTELSDFALRGETFAATGTVVLRGEGVERVRFPSMRLNRGDDFSLDVERRGEGYAVSVRGRSLDARSIVKLQTGGKANAADEGAATPLTVDLKVDTLTGFHGETLRDVTLAYSGTGGRSDLAEFSATTASGAQVVFRDGRNGAARSVSMQSADAGALLRFLDVYERMEGGRIALDMSGQGETLSGRIDARDFWLVNEPRLSSIVSSPSAQDGRSLNQAVRGSLDTSRVQFERGYAEVARNGGGAVTLDRGILRGPLIGVSFQGLLHDGDGNMAMTGTFMPAYGLNRIFGEIPLIGQILGNGRDRGLIGITFRLAGRTDEPRLEINPLSVIAPGIFRSVFEFR